MLIFVKCLLTKFIKTFDSSQNFDVDCTVNGTRYLANMYAVSCGRIDKELQTGKQERLTTIVNDKQWKMFKIVYD